MTSPLSDAKRELLRRRLSGRSPAAAPVIPAAQRTTDIPLTPSQEAIWGQQELDPLAPMFNVPIAWRLEGPLDIARLQNSFDATVARHSALRLRVSVNNAKPVQYLDKDAPVALRVLEAADAAEAIRAVRDEVRKPFDIAGPLVRAYLFRVSAEESFLAITLHHLICDGWSIGILLKDLCAFYSEGELPAAAAVQFVDLLEWRTKSTASHPERATQVHGFWQQQLANAPVLSTFPSEKPRPAMRSGAGRRITVALSDSLLPRVSAFAQAHQATSFMVLFAVYAVLLGRHATQKDIVVGTPSAGRNEPATAEVVGLLTESLPLRLNLGAAPHFTKLVEQVKDSLLTAYEHSLPLSEICDAAQLARSTSHMTPFQTEFTYTPGNVGGNPLGDTLAVTLVPIDLGSAKYDLLFDVYAEQGRLHASIEFATERYSVADVERIAARYETLCTSALSHPELPLDELAMLPEAEHKRVLYEWNRTEIVNTAFANVFDWLEDSGARHPSAPALADDAGELTYRDLLDQARSLGQRLQARGAAPDRLCAIYLPRSRDAVQAILGILASGAAYLPLDPEHPLERTGFVLNEANPVAIVTRRSLVGSLPERWRASASCLDDCESGSEASARSGEESGLRASRSNLAYVLYTSGSTGMPKGVAITHEGLLNYMSFACRTYFAGRGRGSLLHSPLSFDLTVTSIFGPLLCGQILHVLPASADVEVLARAIERQGAGTGLAMVKVTPAHLDLLNVLLDFDGGRWHIDTLVVGGEALSERAVEPWRRTGVVDSLINEYGPTETVVGCAVFDAIAHGGDTRTSVPIGRPIDNTRLYVLDDNLSPAASGVQGRLFIAGKGVARGYLGRYDLTLEKFVRDPFDPDPTARMYDSGDLARWFSDGVLEYLGRSDDQIKLRGYRIELGEIEVRLRDAPGVAEAAVTVVTTPSGQRALVGYVVPAASASIVEAELLAHTRERLPAYMVPERLVRMQRLPLTPNGKVDRAALPVPEAPAPQRDQRTPANDLEHDLLRLFRENLRNENLGVDDDFLDAGGNSLLAGRLMLRIRDATGIQLRLRTFYEGPTVAGVAAFIEEQARSGTATTQVHMVRVARHEAAPLSLNQQRLWVLYQMAPDSPFYNVALALSLPHGVDASALSRSVDELVRRHEPLRTRFEMVDDSPVQRIMPAHAGVLTTVVVDDLVECQARLNAEGQRPFALEVEPPLRATWVRTPTGGVLQLVVHHLVCDAWSSQILLSELRSIYDAFVAHHEHALPTLKYQYADYADWQRRHLNESRLEQLREHWAGQLEGAPQIVTFPPDHRRPPTQGHRGSRVTFEIEASTVQRLGALARARGHTLFSALLAAYGVLLSRCSGLEDIVVGVPTAGRDRTEAESMVGFFANLLPVRLVVARNTTFVDLLALAGRAAQDALDHQQLPFEQIVARVQPARSPDHSPLVQTRFGLQDIPPHKESSIPATDESDTSDVDVPRSELTSSRFDTGVYLWQRGERLQGAFVYDIDLYERATASRLVEAFLRVLRAAVDAPHLGIGMFPVPDAGAMPEPLPVPQPFEADGVEVGPLDVHASVAAHARRHPERRALVHAGDAMSFGQLDLRAARLAAFLQRSGAREGDHIGVHLPRSLDLVVAILGILKSGCAYVPLDPSYPESRRQIMARDAGITLCVGSATPDDAYPAWTRHWIDISVSRDESMPAVLDLPSTGQDGPAYVIYTSGSTGTPKGVVVGHHALRHYVSTLSGSIGLAGSASRFLHTASFSFSSSVRQLFVPLTLGATCHIATLESIADPQNLFQQIKSCGIEVIDLVPSYFQTCTEVLSSLPSERRSDLLCNDLRWILSASERLSSTLVRSWYEGFAHPANIVNMYGQTETCGIVCIHLVPRTHGRDTAVPIGRPLAGTTVRLLDSHGNAVPQGGEGEIVISGRQLATRFTDAPFPVSSYFTGDFAKLNTDGQLVHVGRRDDVVKIRGHRLHLVDLQQALHDDPQVATAAAMSIVPVGSNDSGELMLAAAVVLHDGADGTAEILQRLRSRVPHYMVPTRLIGVPQLPTTANGKLDRESLRRLLETRPEATDANAAAPVTQGSLAQQTLLKLFRQVLKRDTVGADDNFFEAGGDSLAAIRIVMLARKAGLRLTTTQFMSAPSAASLASEIDTTRADAAAGSEASGIATTDEIGIDHARTGELPLTPSHCAFFARRMPDEARRAEPLIFDVPQALHPSAMSAAVASVVAHHDALRLVFIRDTGVHRACVKASPEVPPFSWHDLSDLGLGESAKEEQRIANELLDRFDLERGPLFHVALLHFGLQRPDRLAVVIHHQLTDAASSGMLLDDLLAAYQAAQTGVVVSLPSAGASFRAWAMRLRAHADSRAVASQFAYWKDCVERARGAEFPRDHDAGVDLISTACTLQVDFTAAQTDAMKAGGHLRERVISAMAAALCAHSGRSRLLFALPERGRERLFSDLDVSRTFGRFSIAAQILVDVDPSMAPQRHLGWIREQMARIPERGEAHGLLRFSTSNELMRAQLADLAWPRIMCSYRGDYESSTSTSGVFGLPQSNLRWLPEGGTRQYELYVVSTVVAGELRVRWGYNPQLHRHETMEAVTADFRRRMEADLHG